MEQQTIEEFLSEKKRRCAVYLLGHGSYREPRLIELQYLQIERIVSMLQERDIVVEMPPAQDVYIDLNLPRKTLYSTWDDRFNLTGFPAFSRLVREIIDRKTYDFVWVNIQPHREFQTESYSALLHGLENIVRVENAYFDERLAAHLEKSYGEAGRHASYRITDGSDLLCFFPSLGASVIDAATYNLETSEKISGITDFYRQLNPYSRGSYPFIEERLRGELRTKATAQRDQKTKERFDTETLYHIGFQLSGFKPSSEQLTVLMGRNSGEYIFAENRLLNEMKFEKVVDGRIVAFQRTMSDDIFIYANPCIPGRLDFNAFRKSIRQNRKKQEAYYEHIGRYYILDTWRKGLNEKLEEWCRSVSGYPAQASSTTTV